MDTQTKRIEDLPVEAEQAAEVKGGLVPDGPERWSSKLTVPDGPERTFTLLP